RAGGLEGRIARVPEGRQCGAVDLRPRATGGVPGAGRAVRELHPPAGDHADGAAGRAGRVARPVDHRRHAEPVLADRHRHAGRPRRQERHPDRGIRQPVARRRPQHPRGDHRIGRGAPAPDPDDLDRDHGRRGAAGGRRRPRLGQSRDDRRRGDLRCRLLDAAVAVRGAGVLRPAGPVHALAARGRARTARARSGRAPGRGGVMPAPAAAATRRGIHALHVLALLYVAAAVAAMAWLSPRVPYADAWRHLGRYLALPFPRDVLAPDNGHQEILPNLVRVAELRLFEGGQWLQIAVGIVLVLLTLATCWRALRGLEPARRAAAWLGAVLGVCWLGNIRALAHANESVHAYSVTLLLAIGLLALARARPADALARTALAAACGLGAAFSFGSGIAAFAAFAAVLLLRRAQWREWAVLLAGLATTLVLVQWNGGGTPSPEWAPLRQ